MIVTSFIVGSVRCVLETYVKYRVIINNLYGSEFRIRDINENFVGMDFTCEF